MRWHRGWMFFVGALLVLTCGGFLRGGSEKPPASSEAVQPVDWSPLLPSGPGRDYTAALCGGCHTVGVLMINNRSRQGWKDQLQAMNAARETGGELCACIGGPLNQEEIEILSSYLGEAFGPQNPINQLPLNLNTASERALLRLPGLTRSDVQKLLDSRQRTAIKDKSQVEKLLGHEKFGRIQDFIDFKDSNFRSEGLLPM